MNYNIAQAKKICIISSPRTASTFLYQVISLYNMKTNDVKFDYCEPFRQEKYKDKEGMQSILADMRSNDVLVVKLHFMDIVNLQEMNLWEEFLSIPDYFLQLYRKNLFESSLSLAISWQKNQWIHDLDDSKLVLDLKIFEQAIRNQWRNINFTGPYNDLGIQYNQQITLEDHIKDTATDTWHAVSGILDNSEVTTSVGKSPEKTQVVLNLNDVEVMWNEVSVDLPKYNGQQLDGKYVTYIS